MIPPSDPEQPAREKTYSPWTEDTKRRRLALFLETYPLYRKLDVWVNEWPARMTLTLDVRLSLVCEGCNGVARTFAIEHQGSQAGATVVMLDTVAVVIFRCTHCNETRHHFALLLSERPQRETKQTDGTPRQLREEERRFFLQKVGQYPSLRREVPVSLRALISAEDADLLKKGLTSEGTGYGIGAFAYYRRVVENVIDKLLDSLAAYASAEGDARFASAVAELKNAQQASHKIEAVKDLLPPSLRLGGFNPLGKVYEQLSVGIHELTDEECLDRANALLTVLTTLVWQVNTQSAVGEAYRRAAAKLMGPSTAPAVEPPAVPEGIDPEPQEEGP
jgi:hypothetical protein